MSVTLISFIIVCAFFIFVIECVRRGILETKYSIVWIITCVIMGALSISDKLLEYLAGIIGVVYAPSLLFLFGLLAILIMVFDLTRRISRLSNQIIYLTQENALSREEYRKEMEQMKKQMEDVVKKS